MKNKVFVYCRKSQESEERQALSIPSQIEELQKVAIRQELEIVKLYQESQSAKKPGRPIFNQMLIDMEKQGIKSVLVWNPDRLSRNSVDSGKIIYLMDQNIIMEVVTPMQTIKNTPNDKFLFSILCSQAKLENDNRGINAKRGMLTKAEMGWYPAPAPTGYVNVTTETKGFKTIKIDPVKWPIIKRCFESILDGMKPFEVYEKASKEWKLTNNNGTITSKSGFYYIINNPFYCGEFEWPSKSKNWYEGKHVPVVSKKDFRKIQMMLGNKGAPVKHSTFYTYGGLMRCAECGHGFSGDHKEKYYPKTNNTGDYLYYRCTKKTKDQSCHQEPISEKLLEDQLKEHLLSIRPPQGFLDWAKKWIAELHEYNSGFHQDVRESLNNRKENIEKSLDRLLDLQISGEITQEKYNEKKKKFEEESRDIDDGIRTNNDGSNDWRAKVESTLDFAQVAHQRFCDTKDPEVKRYFITHLGANLLCNHKKVGIDLETHFLEFTEEDKWDDKYKNWCEPVEYTEIMDKKPDLRPQNPNWLEDRNTNITTQLAGIFKAFSDFKLVAQIREEIEKVNQINILPI